MENIKIPKEIILYLQRNAGSGNRSDLVGSIIRCLSWSNDNDNNKLKDFPLKKDNFYYYLYMENLVGYTVQAHLQIHSLASKIEFPHPSLENIWNPSYITSKNLTQSDKEYIPGKLLNPLFFKVNKNDHLDAYRLKIRVSIFETKVGYIPEHLITEYIFYSEEDNFVSPQRPENKSDIMIEIDNSL